MNKPLKTYIDLCVIDNNFEIESQALDQHARDSFLDVLMQHDPVMQELVLDRMQVLIDERMPWVETAYNYSRGLVPIIDQTNGELNWIKRGAA